MKRYARICWNSLGWRRPSGDAAGLEASDSYVAQEGFGHEEWIFDGSWPYADYRGGKGGYLYRFLQPINRGRDAYIGKSMDVRLYTISPKKERLVIADVQDLFVPDDDELAWAMRRMEKSGQLAQMRRELQLVDEEARIPKGPACDVINIRFRGKDVMMHDPPLLAPQGHPARTARRYQMLEWSEDDPPLLGGGVDATIGPSRSETPEGQLKSEDAFMRSPVDAVSIDPQHARLQNALFGVLKERYGKSAVHYERDCVDLWLTTPRETVLFEIKIAMTAKSCIRQAIGQLLEYNHYPSTTRAKQLVVVGDCAIRPDDITYVKSLRSLYGLPIYYARWDWEQNQLEAPV